jgi:hypothetical protein
VQDELRRPGPPPASARPGDGPSTQHPSGGDRGQPLPVLHRMPSAAATASPTLRLAALGPPPSIPSGSPPPRGPPRALGQAAEVGQVGARVRAADGGDRAVMPSASEIATPTVLLPNAEAAALVAPTAVAARTSPPMTVLLPRMARPEPRRAVPAPLCGAAPSTVAHGRGGGADGAVRHHRTCSAPWPRRSRSSMLSEVARPAAGPHRCAGRLRPRPAGMSSAFQSSTQPSRTWPASRQRPSTRGRAPTRPTVAPTQAPDRGAHRRRSTGRRPEEIEAGRRRPRRLEPMKATTDSSAPSGTR